MSRRICLRWPFLWRAMVLGALAFALMGAATTQKPPGDGARVSQEELESLLAPIALYPDGLLAQVLMASTYPLEVVEADRFVKQNPTLDAAALDDALANRKWDPSVQSLAAYPKVLAMMTDRLEWTERLGNAVLEDQPRVMETVQALRRRARSTGNLESSTTQKVIHDKETIVIEPAQTNVVYVAEYDPAVVYGAAWYAGASYYYERYYGRYGYSVSVSYTSYHVSSSHYGWARANWNERSVVIDGRNSRFTSSSARAPTSAGSWQHDPAHRGNVSYPTSAMQERFAQSKAPPNGLQLPGTSRAGGALDAMRDSHAFGDRAPPSSPGGGPSHAGLGAPPGFGGGGPPSFGGGMLGPPPGPPPLPH